MWFKNLRVYKLTKSIDLSTETLEQSLEQNKYSPCTNLDFSRYGWVPPLGIHGTTYTHSCAGFIMICARKQEKIMPPAAINEMVNERVSELEANQGRSIYRKEKRTLKEDAIHSLLPRALTRSALTYAYFVPNQKLLIIDTSSEKKAEEFLDHLRASLESLPVVPLSCHGDAAAIMTRWIKQTPPKGFELDDECELQNERDSKNIVRCKNQELESEEILNHIKAGKRVTQLALSWKDSTRFVLGDGFTIKRLRFSDMIQEQAETESDDYASQFDQDFSVMSLHINQLLEEILEALGGIKKD